MITGTEVKMITVTMLIFYLQIQIPFEPIHKFDAIYLNTMEDCQFESIWLTTKNTNIDRVYCLDWKIK